MMSASTPYRDRLAFVGFIVILLLAQSIAWVAPAGATTWVGVDFRYDKGTSHCIAVYSCSPDPTLRLRYSDTYSVYSETWTSSSGNSNGSSWPGDQSDPIFGKKGKNPCLIGVGWIPDSSGTNPQYGNTFSNSYKTRNFPNYDQGTSIWGWVHFIYQGSFSWLDGANCGDNDSSFDRTELFIHSEMTISQGQNASVEGTELGYELARL